MKEYNFKEIEKKWQKVWEDTQCFHAVTGENKPKYYALVEFPYPSGQGLHVGHPRPYTALDIISRKKRMQGYNVLFPMGFDAFGLPTENYAIKTGIHPAIVTKNNINHFKEQLKSLGYSFDWQREIDTTDPSYYKWTQWIFLKLFEKGLAYKEEIPINFCTSCKVGLANEEVVNGVCERCGGEVVRKVKKQWMLKITEYAQKLLDDLEDVDYIQRVKISQQNWIGRSEGAEINFPIDNTNEHLVVYTTRPDTIYGATYMVISPEHPVIEKYKDKIENIDEVRKYQEEASKKSDFERTELAKEKTGVRLKGLEIINPITNDKLPLFISDYVIMGYGTGAIMAVPAHDQRDYDFAKKFNLPIIQVVSGGDISNEAYSGVGKLMNSPLIDDSSVEEAKKKMIDIVEEKGIGKRKVNFKLRDWVFSRQRYWGEPIPIIHCPKCGYVPLSEDELPLTLPEVDNYKPSDDGESPLSNMPKWYNVKCPKCGIDAKRETDTMPQWAGSSWYFLRYTDPHNDKELASKEALDYWMNVDWYNGGMEHTTLHLLYSRFWHKFLYDMGIVNTSEPYKKRTSHGMILGENGEKMSKSRGNVVNPEDVIDTYGADTLRMYEMFIGDFEKVAPWSENGVRGCKRFIDRVSKMEDMLINGDEYRKETTADMHRLIKKVSDDMENMKFNTSIAALMKIANTFSNIGSINKAEYKTFLTLLNPIAPHITEELWEKAGFEGYLHDSSWPEYDKTKTEYTMIEIPIQVNGKFKTKISVSKQASESEVKEIVNNDETIQNALKGKNVVKEIYVNGRIYNIVVK